MAGVENPCVVRHNCQLPHLSLAVRAARCGCQETTGRELQASNTQIPTLEDTSILGLLLSKNIKDQGILPITANKLLACGTELVQPPFHIP